MKTLKELAQEALDVQNASNLSGVVHSFSRAVTELREALLIESKGSGISSDELNRHPIVILWVDKLMSLSSANERAFSAYQAVHNLAEGSQ